jgi:pilus assembly protein FimV
MRALVTALLTAVVLLPSSAAALELGRSKILSGLGEPLDLEIPVLQGKPEELENLRPQIPERSRPSAMASVSVELERPASGDPVVRVRTRDPINVSALSFLVVADWGRGRTLRAYTVLVKEKPPAPPAPVQSPTSLSTAPAPADAPVEAAPAAAPPVATTPQTRTPVVAETVIPAASVPKVGTDTRTVRRSETLMSISREWSARTGATLAQTMLGIYRANPEAFGNGMGDMKVGSTLKLPDAATLRAASNAEASREVGRQLGIWGQSAPASPAPAASTPKLAPPVATKPAPSAAKPSAALTLAPTTPAAAPAPIAIAPAAAPPAPVAKDPAFKSLEARVAQAERELAALQARLGQVEKIKTAPPVVTAPPIAVAPPAVTPPPAAAAPAPLTFGEPSPPSATGAKDPAAPAEPTSPATSGAASGGAPEAPTNDAAKAAPAASGPKVPSLPAAPPFKPAPSLQERALEIAKHYWWALAGAGGALLLGIAALVIVRRRRAAAAASSEPAQEMTFDLPPIKPSRAEPEDLDDVLMRPEGNAGGASSGGAAAGAAAGLGAAAMAAMEPAASVPETRVAPPPLPNDLEGDPPPIDEAGSMIDLARAYIEMGNFDSAMMELQTALRTGDEAQRAEALRLLDSLPKS